MYASYTKNVPLRIFWHLLSLEEDSAQATSVQSQRSLRGDLVKGIPMFWISVRVIILNLQINVEFEVYLKHLDLRDEKFVMKHLSCSVRKYIKHRYGLQCFHWVLSSYKFPARSLESSNGHCGRTSQHRQKRQRTSWAVVTCVTWSWKFTPKQALTVKEISRMVNRDISDTSKKRCVWRPCRNANEPVAEITDLSLQNMPKGKQVWLSGVWCFGIGEYWRLGSSVCSVI